MSHRPELWARKGTVPGTLLVRLLPGADVSDLLYEHGGVFGLPVGTIAHRVHLPDIQSEILARRLVEAGLVEYAEPDRLIPQAVVPNDPNVVSTFIATQNMPGAWNISKGSHSFSVAVLDTGCDTAHEDLQVNILSGWNVLSSSTDVTDNDGHGTQTCSIVGATTNNGKGIAAIGWGTSVVPVKIVNTGAASSSNMAAGLDWVRLNTAARFASISFAPNGGWGFSDSTLNIAINNCWNANILCFFAAGDSNDSIPLPTGNPYALQVGGTNAFNKFQGAFSNYGPGINFYVVATASSCESSAISGNETTYTSLAGTSASCPVAASIAALMLAANSSLSQLEISNLLNNPNLGNVVTSVPDGSSPIALDAVRLVYAAAYPNPIIGQNQN